MSEEEYMEECERKYIERHTTHIKGYTEEYVNNLQRKVEQLVLEIERLNNIINELEEELDRGYRDLFDMELVPGRELILNIKNYLEELKEE